MNVTEEEAIIKLEPQQQQQQQLELQLPVVIVVNMQFIVAHYILSRYLRFSCEFGPHSSLFALAAS